MNNDGTPVETGRRTVLKGIAGLGVGAATVTILSGCSEADPTRGIDVAAVTTEVQKAVDEGRVPVGQAAFLESVAAVVTQPRQGEFVVFSNRCPHQGGKVSRVTMNGNLICPLHGSEFNLETGEHMAGPSSADLAKLDVPVKAPQA
ncbi:MAG: Rieske (2Fe-2S) protein [Dermatophilus congolensis]|nr:Rieske (2Fe-2S) protein [Dermatophilus congolensis]